MQVLLMSARLTPVAIAQLLKQTSTTCVLINSQVSRASEEALELLQADVDAPVLPNFLDALNFEDLLSPNVPLPKTNIPPRYDAWVREDLDAVIMHSSGTTGLPKPIYHSQGYPLIYAAAHRLPEERDSFRFNVSTLPLYHVSVVKTAARYASDILIIQGFGLMAPSLSLSIGMPFTLPPASVIPTGKSTLNALQTSGACYLLTVPSIVEEVLGLPGGVGLEALQRLEIVAVGGAPMKESVGNALAAAGVNLLNHWGTCHRSRHLTARPDVFAAFSLGCTELGAIAPIERVPRGYDWRYLMPRSDTGLAITPLNDGSNSYGLTGCPPGWKEPFVVQDLLETNPHDYKQYRIKGRADDLLVLATGEKVRPTNLERALAEHPDVKDVLAFGEGQVRLGLLVEIAADKFQVDHGEPENVDAILSSIEPYLERGNSFTDKHGKVTKDMIIITRESTKPLLRTDKGSLARKANLAAFDAEIRACYEHTDIFNGTPLPLADVDDGYALLNSIRSILRDIIGHASFGDDVDFFEAGMDSLQASRLRRSILTRLRATPNLPTPVEDLQSDFCFENSSVRKLHLALIQLMAGTQVDRPAGQSKELKRIAAMEEMVEKYRQILVNMSYLAFHARISRSKRQSKEHGSVVLLTGSTGSLGCFLLARLAKDSTVSKVICLNRPQSGSVDIHQRQMDLMAKRGISMSTEAWKKVVLHGAEMGREDFGLGDEEFDDVCSLCCAFTID
jgi:acyl-CoA synthetase (AMP-forming)/AMP-acid ligase II